MGIDIKPIIKLPKRITGNMGVGICRSLMVAVADDLHGDERVDAAFVREFHVQLIQNLCEHFGIICHDNVNMDRFQVFHVIFLVDCPVLYRDIV